MTSGRRPLAPDGLAAPLSGCSTARAGRVLGVVLVVAALCAACASARDPGQAGDQGDPAAAVSDTMATAVPTGPPSTPPASPAGEQYCFDPSDPATCIPAESSTDAWTAEKQNLVLPYSKRLHEALGMNEDLLRIIWDPLTIEVAWPEPLPVTLDALIAEAAADGITVVREEIAMSQAEVEALMMRLAEALAAAGIPWTSCGPERGYTALRVGTAEPLDDADRQQILDIAAEVVPGMAITFEVVPAPVSLMITELQTASPGGTDGP